MKNYGFIVLFSISTCSMSFAVSVSDWFMKTTPEQKIQAIQEKTQQLLAELKTLKTCSLARSCTQAQYDRIKQLGKQIGAATLVMLGAAVLAGIGIRAHMVPTADNAVRRFNVDLTHQLSGKNDYDLLNLAVAPTDAPWGIKMGVALSKSSLRGLQAARWIIDNRKPKDDYERNLFIDVYNTLTTHIKKLESGS